MPLLLIILLAWAFALLLVAGLCTMARRGDAALADPAPLFDGEQRQVVPGLTLLASQGGGAPARAAVAHAELRVPTRGVPADVAA